MGEGERYNLTTTTYKLAMKELIKQVYVECKERGQLLENIWVEAMEMKSNEQNKICIFTSFMNFRPFSTAFIGI